MNESIEEIEKLLVKPKEWKYAGEVDIKKRPKNSLLEREEIDFKQGPPLIPFSSKQDSEVESITLQRIREGTFDNHEYNIKEVVEIVDEVPDTENPECKDIISLYNEIEGDLMQIVDFGNNGFVPDCEIRIVQGKEDGSGPRKKLDVKSLDRIRNVTVLKKN
ncbi:U3 small nucleolar ribonucleoprotein component Mpp10 [Encephalitozoon romaleae SJ-2008]|uniref:U3 small nucleolar ribonucleoprotein component Mpp10 n=1 Tax=Encephalitozoon romaleae (strain SJ-2008) TaxID=1178016 RepID=I6ZRZ2_ENCRO|nr:U3 small nucleolar ribonucleoprotein component Mpp10 [Encephalitozoon romaleae SJ-2008]AFN82356.1 U3 small nucleolar ribonucleoprotein component Mpp10 [Encephalitozoon romaleae SJ-2008]